MKTGPLVSEALRWHTCMELNGCRGRKGNTTGLIVRETSPPRGLEALRQHHGRITVLTANGRAEPGPGERIERRGGPSGKRDGSSQRTGKKQEDLPKLSKENSHISLHNREKKRREKGGESTSKSLQGAAS